MLNLNTDSDWTYCLWSYKWLYSVKYKWLNMVIIYLMYILLFIIFLFCLNTSWLRLYSLAYLSFIKYIYVYIKYIFK